MVATLGVSPLSRVARLVLVTPATTLLGLVPSPPSEKDALYHLLYSSYVSVINGLKNIHLYRFIFH